MGQRLALIIGNSLYSDTTLARLLTPDVDVGALGEILLDTEQGGFDDVDVLVNMSSTVIRRSIASFFAKRSREDLLLLYFSGHGVLDDQGLLYLAIRDTDSKLLRGTAISAGFITDEMNNSRSQRQVLILDCCHSGAFARGAKGKPGNSVGTASAFEGSGYGRVVLTASDATQYAWEGDQVIGDAENSLFTHYILEGIKSGAADTNGDGQITIDELYDYVYEHVIRQTPRQTPGKWSYKEQGQIIIARVLQGTSDSSSADKLRDFDPNLDERLDKLYNEGLGAYWLEEWDKAIRCFQAIMEVQPDYPDAANKYELSKRQQRLLTLYDQVIEAEEDGDWLLAVSRLDELLSLAPDYRDARQRLEVAKRNRLLSDLYAEARQLTKAGNYRAVLNIFTRIADLQPAFPDPDGLLPTAEKEVAAQQHQAELDKIYHQALREMDAGNWQAAEGLLRELQTDSPDYSGVDRLLERAKTERTKDEADRQRDEQITMLSQQAVGLARAKQWHQVLAKIEEIQAINPTYEDSDQLAATAREEIERQILETRREAQLAEMYAAAVKSLGVGEYQKALQQWGEIQVLDPKYPDRKKVRKTAKKKLASISKPKVQFRISRKVVLWIGGILTLILATVGAWYGWQKSHIIFFDDFSNPKFSGDYDKSKWTKDTDFTTLGWITQSPNGYLKLFVSSGFNDLGEFATDIYAAPLIPKIKEPATCEANLNLVYLSTISGSASLRVLIYHADGGEYHSQISCQIFHLKDDLQQYFNCYSGGHSASGDYRDYVNTKQTEISPGTWHKVAILVDPEGQSFQVWFDDEEFYTSQRINDFRESEFSCQVQVDNNNEDKRYVVGYFDNFKITKGTAIK